MNYGVEIFSTCFPPLRLIAPRHAWCEQALLISLSHRTILGLGLYWRCEPVLALSSFWHIQDNGKCSKWNLKYNKNINNNESVVLWYTEWSDRLICFSFFWFKLEAEKISLYGLLFFGGGVRKSLFLGININPVTSHYCSSQSCFN